MPRGVSVSVVDAGSHKHSHLADGQHSIEKGMTSSPSSLRLPPASRLTNNMTTFAIRTLPFCAIWKLNLHMFTPSKYPCAYLVVPAHHSGTVAAPRLAAGASSSCHRAPRCTFPEFPPLRRRVADPDDLYRNILSEDCDALKPSRRGFQHAYGRSMVSNDRPHLLCNARRVFAAEAGGAIGWLYG